MTVLREGAVVIPVHKPSSKERFFFLISGMISSVPLTLFVSQFTDSLAIALSPVYALLFSSVLVAPFLEEFAKAFPLFYRHGETQRSIFTLGFLVGLGFGIVEFILYVFIFGVPFYYRIAGLLFHGATTSIIAYGIATKRAAMFYLLAVSLHLLNNFIAFGQLLTDSSALLSLLYLGVFAVIFTTLFLSWQLYTKTSQKIIQWS